MTPAGPAAHNPRVPRLAAFLAVALLLATASLSAQPSTPRYREAVAAYASQDFATARGLLLPLWEETHNLDALRILTQAEEQLALWGDVVRHAPLYLARTTRPRTDPDVVAMTERLAEARRHTATLHLRGALPGAQLTLDLEPLALPTDDSGIALGEGQHAIELRREGYAPWRIVLRVEAGQVVHRDVTQTRQR